MPNINREQTKKPKMLYMMIVDWAWIKQRPHFLAEELAKCYDLLVLYPFSNRRKGLQKGKRTDIRHIPIFSLPKERRIPLIRHINLFFKRLSVRLMYHVFRPEYVWVSLPSVYRLLPEHMWGKVIYDCMDDYAAMAATEEARRELLDDEARLVARADYLIVSSGELRKVLMRRYPQLDPAWINLVRNGYNGELSELRDAGRDTDTYKIGYVGTISHWFDWALIKQSLDEFPNIEYHLIGPVDAGTERVYHQRIRYYNTVEHDKLYDTVCDFDLMCMPFVMNDIVKSVDPVKLYEYINYGKDILCIRYDEIERFEPFVYFYSNYGEYAEALRNLLARPKLKYSDEQRKLFLSRNSWHDRGLQIQALIAGQTARDEKRG